MKKGIIIMIIQKNVQNVVVGNVQGLKVIEMEIKTTEQIRHENLTIQQYEQKRAIKWVRVDDIKKVLYDDGLYDENKIFILKAELSQSSKDKG